LGSHSGGEFHVVTEAHIVFVRNQRALLRFDPGIFTGNDAEAVNEENVGAKIGDAIGHVQIEAVDDAHDEDEGGNSENQPRSVRKLRSLWARRALKANFRVSLKVTKAARRPLARDWDTTAPPPEGGTRVKSSMGLTAKV